MGNTVNVFIENVAFTVANILASNGTFVNTVNSSANAAIESILNNTTFGITYTTANAGYDFANSVGLTANAAYIVVNSAFDSVNSVAISANSYAGAMTNAANATANSQLESGNLWANAVGVYANSYAVTVGAAANVWANTIGGRSNTWANSVGVAANNFLMDWSNTKFIANTTNTTFNGNFFVAGSVMVRQGALFETRVNLGAGTLFNLDSGNYFTKTISGATTLTFDKYPFSGNVSSFILELTNGGSSTITWWSGIKWAGGNTPVFTTTGKDVLGFYSHDGGITWTGLLLAKDIK